MLQDTLLDAALPGGALHCMAFAAGAAHVHWKAAAFLAPAWAALLSNRPPVFLQAVLGGGGAGVPGQVVSVSASCRGREGSGVNCMPLAAKRDIGAAHHSLRWHGSQP